MAPPFAIAVGARDVSSNLTSRTGDPAVIFPFAVRALMLEAPASLLEERRRLGLDSRDEVWEGILHMVPPPTYWHQRFSGDLFLLLAQAAKARGIEAVYETAVYDPDKASSDYRVPDLAFTVPAQRSDRGIEGAAVLVVEVLSPDDESRDKLPFYARVGVREVWIIDPGSRQLELYVLRGDSYHAALPDEGGVFHSPALGVSLAVVSGPRLRVSVTGEADQLI